MAEIVNLNRVRKDKARAEKEAKAAENRAVHGRPKNERDLEAAREEQRRQLLDMHRLDDSET